MIKKLPECIISKISAGEVIVSPYNVIKECLENSLDAKASLISISLSSNLLSFSIRDNGSGISKEDFKFLCLNHYTSKIIVLEDLFKCGSIRNFSNFGFRGEALHSINVCAQLKISSKNNEKLDYGYMGFYKLGELIEILKIPMEKCGTIIEVSDLFYNNIIRKEFFNKNKKECLKCINLIKSYGCIYSGIELIVDSKVVICRDIKDKKLIFNENDDLNKKNILKNKINYILENFFENKIKINEIEKVFNNKYLVIFTNRFKNFKKYLFILFINNRLVNNITLKNKILQKYKNIIKQGTYPFIYIEIFTEYADVNVHPSKSEVFIDDKNIYDEIYNSISNGLNIDKMNIKGINSQSKIEKLNENKNNLLNSSFLKEEFFDKDISNNESFSTQNSIKIYSLENIKSLDDYNIFKTENKTQKLINKIEPFDKNICENLNKKYENSFIKSLIYVGYTDYYIFVQADSNLLKIDRFNFIFEILYFNLKNGRFMIQEIDSCNVNINEKYWDLFNKFGIKIINNKIIKAPLICGMIMNNWEDFDFSIKCIENLDKNEIIDFNQYLDIISKSIANFYKTISINSKIFNLIKKEIIETETIYKSFKILVSLKDLYKKFGRC